MPIELAPDAEQAFQDFLKRGAPANYDASNEDARHIWQAAWAAANAPSRSASSGEAAPSPAARREIDENALRRLVSEYRQACEMVRGHAIPQWRTLMTHVKSLVGDATSDTARIDMIEKAIQEGGAVWLLPSGAENRFVQVRTAAECHNFPTVPGLRAALDAAFLPQQSTTAKKANS